MSRGGIIIQNRSDGRGMMVPEREGRGTFNKLPFVSMACPKEEIVINPIPNKVIIKTRKGIYYFNVAPWKGDRYEGDWKNGHKEGKGIYYFNNGNRYEGDWKNGQKEGKGIFYCKNGDRYEGDFRNDKREGKGIYYFNDGDRYEGDFKNGKFEGKGIYYYNDGDRYEGDWRNDEKEIGKHVTLTFNGEVKTKIYN